MKMDELNININNFSSRKDIPLKQIIKNNKN